MCLVDGIGGVRYEDDAIVLKAANWDDARTRALDLGRAKEKTYRNSENRQVRWALERLVTLDELGEIVDGLEIYSQPSNLGIQAVPFDQEFRPELTEPTQSV